MSGHWSDLLIVLDLFAAPHGNAMFRFTIRDALWQPVRLTYKIALRISRR